MVRPLALSLVSLFLSCTGDVEGADTGGGGGGTASAAGGGGALGGGFASSGGGSAGGTAATGGGASSSGGGSAAVGGGSAATGGGSAATGGGSAMLPEDDSVIVSTTLPTQLACSDTLMANVTVRNTGTATWSDAAGYKLGAVGDSDPFYNGTRVSLGSDTVAPGATYVFTLQLVAPVTPGTVTTDWQMVREGVHWFGGKASSDVDVACTMLDPVPDAGPMDFDLGNVTIIGPSPDVRGFAVTSQMTNITFSPGTIHVDHTKRGQWPPVQIDPDGTTQEATIWVFFKINGTWYGTGGERLRPDQTDKGLAQPSLIGSDWFYSSSWAPMSGYVPHPGEWVAFMIVAGSTRADNQTPVMERTDAVVIPFPMDNQTTAFPPFAWSEP
jgi:hypothetical protein